jgi:type I restriction enzyme S subunit
VNPKAFPDLPFIGLEHIEAHTMRLLGTVPASTMRSSAVHFQAGDVLYGRLRPYLNKVFCPNFEGLCSAEFIVFPRNGAISPPYLQYFLNASKFVSFATHLNTGDRPRVDFDQLADYPFLIAPFPEQHRIVAEIEKHFTRLDAAVAALKRAQAQLKRYRAAVLENAFVGQLFGQSQHFGEGRDLPIGWEWKTMRDICVDTPQNGLYLPQSHYGSGIPILRIDDFQNGFHRSADELRRVTANEADAGRYRLRLGDLVINRVNSPSHLGKCLLVTERLLPALFESNMMRVNLAPTVSGRFIEFYLWSPSARRRLTANAKWAVNQASINQQDVLATPVPVPSLPEQREIVSEVERRFSLVDALDHATADALDRAANMRQAILRSGFGGRLVPQDRSDEPASILLERIRVERQTAQATATTKAGRPRKSRPAPSVEFV